MRYMIDRLDLPRDVKEKYENDPKLMKSKVHTYTYAFVCKQCGAEVYSEYEHEKYGLSGEIWDLERKAEKTNSVQERNAIEQELITIRKKHQASSTHKALATERFYAAINNGTCPICGTKLLQEKGYFCSDREIFDAENKKLDYYQKDRLARERYGIMHYFQFDEMTVDDKFRLLERVRKEQRKQEAEELQGNYSQTCDTFVPSKNPTTIMAVKTNTESLKTYILNLIRLENNIYSLQQLLPDLYYRRLENDPVVMFEAYSPVYQAWEELKGLREACYDALEAIERAKVYQPVIDIDYPQKPSTPVLKKPGLFNKQKVLAENEALTKRYQSEMAAYQQDVLRCDEEKKRLSDKKRSIALENAKKKEMEAKRALESAEASLDAKRAALKERLTPAKVAKYIFDQEIAAAEELLQKTYAARNELYAYDIVFDKYRNPVALSSFYEYLMSGRCSALEGADGAYNIYESEIRANRVIAQLDAVVSSLEDIKHNQYMMYQEMCRTNSLLENLNSTMDQALTSIQSIEANTSKIAENSAVIAHNSAITAYYSKVNAELTNAMGFMMAYKL